MKNSVLSSTVRQGAVLGRQHETRQSYPKPSTASGFKAALEQRVRTRGLRDHFCILRMLLWPQRTRVTPVLQLQACGLEHVCNVCCVARPSSYVQPLPGPASLKAIFQATPKPRGTTQEAPGLGRFHILGQGSSQS